MASFELQTEIEAPPEVVFDLLADHTKYPLWRPDISEAKQGQLNAGLGGRLWLGYICYFP